MMCLLAIKPNFRSCGSIRYIKTVLMHLYGQSMLGKASFSGKIDYCVIRADLHTFSARGTFAIINYCKIILYMNSIVGAYLFTLFTGNTGILAYLSGNGAFVKGFTSYVYHFGFRQYTDYFSGTDSRTFPTACTAFFNYFWNAILPIYIASNLHASTHVPKPRQP